MQTYCIPKVCKHPNIILLYVISFILALIAWQNKNINYIKYTLIQRSHATRKTVKALEFENSIPISIVNKPWFLQYLFKIGRKSGKYDPIWLRNQPICYRNVMKGDRFASVYFLFHDVYCVLRGNFSHEIHHGKVKETITNMLLVCSSSDLAIFQETPWYWQSPVVLFLL